MGDPPETPRRNLTGAVVPAVAAAALAAVGAILCIAWIVLTIVAAIKAHEGTAYRYPFTLRLVN